jgi:glutathione S-transferase
MQLYEDHRAPNPRRVRIFLAEKGIEIERRQLDIMSGEHKSPEMLALNPSARVPFLVLDDGTVIAETMAICRYVDALHPEPAIFGWVWRNVCMTGTSRSFSIWRCHISTIPISRAPLPNKAGSGCSAST